MREMLWIILSISLLSACVMDCISCEVYNVTWWFGGTAALLLFLTGGRERKEMLVGLVVFAGLQLVVFARMYGKADCYAFCVCAVAYAAAGIDMVGYLLHMLLSFMLLAVVQGARRNIGKDGNLKTPVPFLPYITLAFLILLWYHVTVRG